MNYFEIALWGFALLFLFLYFFFKYRKRCYFFSGYNIGLYSYTVSVVIAPIYFFVDDAWITLGVHNPFAYFSHLNQCIFLNSIGLIFFTCGVILGEFGKGKKSLYFVERYSKKLKHNNIVFIFWISVIFWLYIVFKYNGGIPLLNGGRIFYLNSPISPIYLALSEIILVMSLYFGYRWVIWSNDFFKWGIATILLLGTGNRGSSIVISIAPIAVIYLYYRLNKNNFIDGVIINPKKATKRIFCLLFFLFIFGILIQGVRYNGGVGLRSIFEELLYGNTFCDFRDGAFVLKGFDSQYSQEPIYGKSYLAGILSFIPSSFSDFRLEWSYGRFTTTGLFGFNNHAGLRGGLALEPFLNFGIFGIVFFSCIQGYLLGVLEKNYYFVFLLNKKIPSCKEIFILQIIFAIKCFFECSASSFTIYIDIFLIILLLLIPFNNFNFYIIRHTLFLKKSLF